MSKGAIKIKSRMNRIKLLEKKLKKNVPQGVANDRTEEKEAIKELLRPQDVPKGNADYNRYWQERFDNAPNNNPYDALTVDELKYLISIAEGGD